MLKNLKYLREEAGVTQKQLADAIGVSQQSINKYENHNIEPDIETLIRMADFFRVSVDYLIGYSDTRRKPEILHSCDLSDQERGVIQGFRTLSDKQKKCIETVIDSFGDN